jgi:hypothetical protein
VPSEVFAPGPTGIRLLTQPQLQNSVRALFGSSVKITQLDLQTYSNQAAAVNMSEDMVGQLETLSLEAAKSAFANADFKAQVGCEPQATEGDACTRGFLSKFGRRSWRRPLTAEELDVHAAIAFEAGKTLGAWKGLEVATAAFLQSPEFIYRVELGVDDPANPEQIRFTGLELASRLAFFLWNSLPDDALLDAAVRGDLDTTDGLRAQVRRMLDSQQARIGVSRFLGDWLLLDELDDIEQKLVTNFSMLTGTLGPAMREELTRKWEDLVLDRGGDYRDFFVQRETFVNPELARFYGLPEPTSGGFERVTMPDTWMRAGLLGSGGFLALPAPAVRTSPTVRGRVVREGILCTTVQDPPDEAFEEQVKTEGLSVRDALADHRVKPACASCHAAMDPIGLGMDNFDALGNFRTTDDRGFTVDATGDLDGVPFRDAKELGVALSQHPALPGCLTKNLFRYVVGRDETEGESVGLQAATAQFAASGYRVRALLEEIVVSDAFRFASKE